MLACSSVCGYLLFRKASFLLSRLMLLVVSDLLDRLFDCSIVRKASFLLSRLKLLVVFDLLDRLFDCSIVRLSPTRVIYIPRSDRSWSECLLAQASITGTSPMLS